MLKMREVKFFNKSSKIMFDIKESRKEFIANFARKR